MGMPPQSHIHWAGCPLLMGAWVRNRRAKGAAMHLPTLSPRRLAGAAAAACAAALIPVAALAATASPAAPSAAAGALACPTGVLALTDVGVFSGRACHPVTAAGLRVYPPNQFTSKLVPYPFGACTTGRVFMRVGAVHMQ